MVDETPVNSTVIENSVGDPETGSERLVGACLSDVLGDGLSMVYSFFDPAEEKRSLGAYMILDHLSLALEMGLAHVYLGYWVASSPKMDYKVGYRPFELCDGTTWRRFQSREEYDAWRSRQKAPVRDPLTG
jgi:arginine-tRNA-protein transferase